MSAVCPACGVAVVPGYVRCPRCQAALPAPSLRRLPTTGPGGTAVAGRSVTALVLLGAGVLILLLVLYLALRDGSSPKPAPVEPTTAEPARDPEPAAGPPPAPPEPAAPITTGNNTIDPNATARDLERVLRRQRLWASVEVVGDRIDVRSSSCRDEGMLPLVEAATAALKNAGLTRIRCVEQSGGVVFERDL